MDTDELMGKVRTVGAAQIVRLVRCGLVVLPHNLLAREHAQVHGAPAPVDYGILYIAAMRDEGLWHQQAEYSHRYADPPIRRRWRCHCAQCL